MTPCQLSVIIPCRDYGRYLTEAIASVLNQQSSIESIEVIVVDDHSSDLETLQVLSYWESADWRVRVVHNTGRSGAAAARNRGVALAHGEWIAFLDADDVWTAGGLQIRWQTIHLYPDAEWIGADFIRWYEDGSLDAQGFFKTRHLPRPSSCWTYESGAVVKLQKPVAEFLQASLGWTSTIIVQKDLLKAVGGFEERLGNYEDHHLWIRLARKADFFFVPAVVVLYRQHPMSVSRENVPPAQWYIKAIHLLLQDPAFQPYRHLLRWKLASLFEQNAYYHRARGEAWLASFAAANAVLHCPSNLRNWKNFLASVLGRR